MSEKTITVTLPELEFHRLQRAAELTYRSIDDIVSSVLNVASSVPPDLPPEVGDELAAMRLFSDDALWAATQPSLSLAEQERLRQLNRIGGERALTQAEATEQAALLEAYQRSVLRRAEALALLRERGHPVSPDTPVPVTES